MTDDTTLQPGQEETTLNGGADPSDKLTPEHPRFKEVIKDNAELKSSNSQLSSTVDALKQEMELLKASIAERQTRENDDATSDEERRALDKINADLKRNGFVTKEDLEASRRIERRAETLEKLSDKFDGTNGYPKFVREDVLDYATRNGFGDNLQAAYKDMHFDAIVQVEGKRGLTPPDSEKPTGTSKAVSGDLTPEKIAEMSDADYEKNRVNILSSMKNSKPS